jgi:hypothetical protein
MRFGSRLSQRLPVRPDSVENREIKQRFCEALMTKYGKPGTSRPKGCFPRIDVITVYAIAVEHITGKQQALPPLAAMAIKSWRSTLPIPKWPPERLLHLVVDGAGIDADVTQDPLVETRELAARHAAAAPRPQARDDRARDQAPARGRHPGRANRSRRRLMPGRCQRGRNGRSHRVPKPGRSDRLLALLQECRHDRLLISLRCD